MSADRDVTDGDQEEAQECGNNRATPGDHHGECLTCNPYRDSLVMNNDPEYLQWLHRREDGL